MSGQVKDIRAWSRLFALFVLALLNEYSTIKPAPYPNNRIVAHIHYVVSAPGYKDRVFEIVFEGDPFIDDRLRADAAKEESVFSIRALTRDQQGVWRCAQDVKMPKQ